MRRGDVRELNPYYNEMNAVSWIMEMKKSSLNARKMKQNKRITLVHEAVRFCYVILLWV